MFPHLRGEGHIDFGADPDGVGTCLSAQYLVNQWWFLSKNRLDLVIWPNFQGHSCKNPENSRCGLCVCVCVWGGGGGGGEGEGWREGEGGIRFLWKDTLLLVYIDYVCCAEILYRMLWWTVYVNLSKCTKNQ